MNTPVLFFTLYLTVSVKAFSDVCYGDLGCFTDRPPYGGTPIRKKGYLPEAPEKVNANFVLFTRKSSGTKIAADNIPLSYNSSLPTHFITHGFIQNAQKQWVGEMKDALLRTKDLNVIAVDWKKGADFPYAQASANTQITGAEIAKLVKILVEKTGADIGEFHLIGHSLGAHVSGYAGERLKGLGRITGLDPAGPLFEYTDPKVRLDPTDAKFVDVIHTDGASILEVGLGLTQQSGHVDFFPNGGCFQPNCPATSYKLLTAIFNFATSNFDALDNISGCSHVASYKFFIDSIENRKCYTSYPCASMEDFDKGNCIKCQQEGCNKMGYWASSSKSLGNQYLNTQDANDVPFCSHNYQITLHSASEEANQASGDIKIRFGEKSAYGYIIEKSGNLLKPGKVSKHLATVNEILNRKIERIFLSYERTSNIFISWLYDSEWPIDYVEVLNGETQTSARYCSKESKMVGYEPKEFILC